MPSRQSSTRHATDRELWHGGKAVLFDTCEAFMPHFYNFLMEILGVYSKNDYVCRTNNTTIDGEMEWILLWKYI